VAACNSVAGPTLDSLYSLYSSYSLNSLNSFSASLADVAKGALLGCFPGLRWRLHTALTLEPAGNLGAHCRP
jgi:hypothetical protein